MRPRRRSVRRAVDDATDLVRIEPRAVVGTLVDANRLRLAEDHRFAADRTARGGGGVDLGFTFYPKYRLFVMLMAGLLVLLTWLFLEKTKYGAIMRAGIENKEMVSLLGIDIHRVFTVAFAIGAFLAGIAGALTAPIRGLSPQMGVDMLGIAFVVVALGGLGNLLGAIAAGLLIGVAQAVVAAYWTEASTAVIFAVMALVLLVRPQGMFGIR